MRKKKIVIIIFFYYYFSDGVTMLGQLNPEQIRRTWQKVQAEI